MTNLKKKKKMTKGSVQQPSKCYKAFSTVVETITGEEVIVMAQSKEALTKYLNRNRCPHFSEDRFQEVVIFSQKDFTDDGEKQ